MSDDALAKLLWSNLDLAIAPAFHYLLFAKSIEVADLEWFRWDLDIFVVVFYFREID